MRKEKELLLNEMKEKIDNSAAMIIAQYEKLEPNTAWRLRDQLLRSGGFLEVVKKQVFIKAAGKAGIALDEDLLKGHVGVVFVNQPDAMPTTKLLYKFSEENGHVLQILCGQIEGKMIPAADLEILSKLPGIDEIRAELLGLFTSPMSQMLAVLEAVLSEPLSVISQKSEMNNM